MMAAENAPEPDIIPPEFPAEEKKVEAPLPKAQSFA